MPASLAVSWSIENRSIGSISVEGERESIPASIERKVKDGSAQGSISVEGEGQGIPTGIEREVEDRST